jgi:hypothetical protein
MIKHQCCKDEFHDMCCCNCYHQYPTTVCNCDGEWPEELIMERSTINERHGSIGWVCLFFLRSEDGPVDVRRHKHGICEEWQKILDNQGEDGVKGE